MSVQGMALRLIAKLPDSVLVKLSGGVPLEVGGRTLNPLLQFIRAQGVKLPSMTSMTPVEAREAMRVGLADLQPKPRVMASKEDLSIPVEGGEIPCRMLTPKDAGNTSPIALYFHQGGCVIGDIDSCEPFCTLLADEAECRVLMVGYRKAPEFPFPTAAEDAIAAHRYAVAHAEALNIDPARIIVAGDSAGGGLSAVICQAMKSAGEPMPCAQVLIYPWVDALPNTESYVEHEYGYPLDKATMGWFADLYLTKPEDADDFRVSPIRTEDLSGLPRALVYTVGFDPLRDEGKAYADKLRAAGVNVEYTCFDHLSHSFTALGGIVPAAMDACLKVAGDLRGVVRG